MTTFAFELDWHADALCREYPNVNWFPERGCDSSEAKAVCRRCLVQRECLEYALSQPPFPGVWGGTDEAERKELRRARRRAL
jgi:WhiB family transcriptional regulator, redox-sensing transcriptional regulator